MGAYNNAMYNLHLDLDQSLIFPSLNLTVLIFFPVTEQIFQKKFTLLLFNFKSDFWV